MFAPTYMGRKRQRRSLDPMILQTGEETVLEAILVIPGVKAFERIVIGPCTLMRTWGTRPGRSEMKVYFATKHLIPGLCCHSRTGRATRRGEFELPTADRVNN